jgi:hypothetical protein
VSPMAQCARSGRLTLAAIALAGLKTRHYNYGERCRRPIFNLGFLGSLAEARRTTERE